MSLPNTACRNAKPGNKLYKLADEKVLHLLVGKAGAKAAKYWRWNYRHAGNCKTMALGVYPDASLAKLNFGRAARQQAPRRLRLARR